MIEDIIFLGAGASRAEGAPLQADLFREYFKLCKPTLGSKPGEKTLFYRMRKFFHDFFGIDVDNDNLEKTSFPTFEEALGVLEISIKREEAFRGWTSDSANSDIKIQRYRRSLIFLIGTVLERTLQNRAIYHRMLVQQLRQQNRLTETAFISVNYEILIDNALMELENIDYGVPIITSQNSYSNNLIMINREHIRLYKLHGSLNWLYCPTCISLIITPFSKSGSELVHERKQCEKCMGPVVPVIVPPTFFKVMSNHFLEQIWYKTDELLRTAKRIIFCGYSFPDADIHIRYLLKRAELYQDRGSEIYVINYHSSKSLEEARNEVNRYKRFFKNKAGVHYLKGSFQQFCESGKPDMPEYEFPSNSI
jgi:hypothetical protein